jgi:hypothetical protein
MARIGIDIDNIVHISTTRSTACVECKSADTTQGFEGAVNHYLTAHNYRLLHVGTESEDGTDGKPPRLSTVAVLGKPWVYKHRSQRDNSAQTPT